MYKICRTEQSALRQRELVRGLLEMMLHTNYDQISVSDLCDQMQIPRKAFYRYFSGKEGALYAMIDLTLMDYEAFVLARLLDRKLTSKTYMESFFIYWQQQEQFLDALSRSGLTGVLVQRAIELARGKEEWPKFSSGDESAQEYISLFAVCGLMSMMTQWHSSGYLQSAEQMAQISVQLLSQPLFPDMDGRS